MNPKNDGNSVSVTRNTPQLVICLVDESESMKTIAETDEKQRSLGEMVQDSLTELIGVLGGECIKGREGFKNYFHLSVLGYHGVNEEVAVIKDLFPNSGGQAPRIRPIQSFFEVVDDDMPFRITPHGLTPTKAAFREAQKLVDRWDEKGVGDSSSSTDRYPAPIIISITDGRYDSTLRGAPKKQHLSPKTIIDEICGKNYSRFDSPLIMNIHISPNDAANKLSFPGEPPEGSDDDMLYARELYDCSSLLTAEMRKYAKENGFDVTDSSRAMLYHANPSDLLKILSIGTIATTIPSITGQKDTPIDIGF